MSKLITRALGLCTALCVFASVAGGASAQNLPAPPPIRQTVDANGVDFVSLAYNLSFPNLVSVGQPGVSGLSLSLYYNSLAGSSPVDHWTFDYFGSVSTSGSLITVGFGPASESFTFNGSTFTSAQGTGATLTTDGRFYTYTRRDDVQIVYDSWLSGSAFSYYGNNWITSVTYPTGEILTVNYLHAYWCKPDGMGGCMNVDVHRVQSITDNLGYQIQFQYGVDDPNVSLLGFYQLTTATAFSLATDYCDPRAVSCTFSRTWPHVTFDNAFYPTTITDALNHTTTIGYTGDNLTSVQQPSGLTLTIGYDGSNRVQSVSNGAAAWTYGYVDSSGFRTTTATEPVAGHQRIVVSDLSTSLVKSDADALAHVTQYEYDPTYGRLTKVTQPLGGYTQIEYDAGAPNGRGNVTKTTQVSQTPGTPANIVVSAVYDTSCTHPAWCNRPESVSDANGNTTGYTYDDTTGQPLTAISPSVSGVQAETRYTYSALHPWYKDVSGSIVQYAGTISMPTGTLACQTQTLDTCLGTTDEVNTSIGYPTGSSGLATTLLPSAVTTKLGTGAQLSQTLTSYDPTGNLSSVQGPQGPAQTTNYYYDLDRKRVGVVGPIPSGRVLNRAARTTYNSDGLVTEVEQGTQTGYNDPTVSGFTTLQQLVPGYDALDRKIVDKVWADGTIWAVTQYHYDDANRLDCTAVRMNRTQFGLPLPEACILGPSGSDGADRITQNLYDLDDRVMEVDGGVGVDLSKDVRITYTADGLVQTLKDANSNLSTYSYDGLDRLTSLQYPDSSYQGYTYDDAHSHPTQMVTLRQRNGQSIGFAYDALNRVASKTPPDEPTTNYSYDNFSRLTSSVGGRTVQFAYDGLGRLTQETQPIGGYNLTLTSAYNPDGTRSRLTWPDSVYVTYDYDALGEMTDVKESSGAVLASFGYDDLGRRTSVSRLNGVSTSYVYNGSGAGPDLIQLSHSGSSNDQSYNPIASNPAGQITSRKGTNDTYAWNAAANLNQTYVPNILNQYQSVGGTTYGYNGGNLTSGPPQSYAFDSQNRLYTASGSPGAILGYDGIDRLNGYQGSIPIQFLYDGDQIVAEYDSTNPTAVLKHRYVDGPGVDEPVVDYDYTASGDQRRFLLADERGSVIAGADSSATVKYIDSYDEYGQPGFANLGRFQYTGQAYIPEAGAYDYKARVYLPSIGRFLQTDPSGYQAGMNLYDYVADDPINFLDPLGLGQCVPGSPADGSCYIQVGGGWGAGSGGSGSATGGGGVLLAPSPCLPPDVSPDDCVRRWTPNPAAAPSPTKCGPTSILPRGAGLAVGGVVAAGLPKAVGAAGEIGMGVGVFSARNAGPSIGGFTYAGGAGYFGSHSRGSQTQVTHPSVLGASMGAGWSVFFTNAQSSNQLSGPFTTRTVNVGIANLQGTISLATSGNIWQLSFSPPVIGGLSVGASGSRISTTTMNTSGCV